MLQAVEVIILNSRRYKHTIETYVVIIGLGCRHSNMRMRVRDVYNNNMLAMYVTRITHFNRLNSLEKISMRSFTFLFTFLARSSPLSPISSSSSTSAALTQVPFHANTNTLAVIVLSLLNLLFGAFYLALSVKSHLEASETISFSRVCVRVCLLYRSQIRFDTLKLIHFQQTLFHKVVNR